MSNTINAHDRLSQRRQGRSLNNFLKFNFGSRKQLAVLEETFNGKTYKVLNVINPDKMGYFDQIKLYWNQSNSLKKVAAFIQENIPNWKLEEKEKVTHIEYQCARFKRSVDSHNSRINKDQKPIDFANPFNKTLNIIIKYPELLKTDGELVTVTHKVAFDRLTTIVELAKQVNAIINKEVDILLPMRFELADPLSVVSGKIPPGYLFKKVEQVPSVLNDPAETDQDVTLTFTFSEPDEGVKNAWLLNRKFQNIILAPK